jgi:hypothetical protein
MDRTLKVCVIFITDPLLIISYAKERKVWGGGRGGEAKVRLHCRGGGGGSLKVKEGGMDSG